MGHEFILIEGQRVCEHCGYVRGEKACSDMKLTPEQLAEKANQFTIDKLNRRLTQRDLMLRFFVKKIPLLRKDINRAMVIVDNKPLLFNIEKDLAKLEEDLKEYENYSRNMSDFNAGGK